MNIVIESMNPKMLRKYMGILEEQNPLWEKQPESFEAIEIAKIGQLLGREVNSSLEPLRQIENLTPKLFLQLREQGYQMKDIGEACGMAKNLFFRWRQANGLITRGRKNNQ